MLQMLCLNGNIIGQFEIESLTFESLESDELKSLVELMKKIAQRRSRR